MIGRKHDRGRCDVDTCVVLMSVLAAVAALARRGRRRAAAWRHATDARLRAESSVVQTAAGPVEYAEAGRSSAGTRSPPLIVLHGTAGGYVSGLVLGRALAASIADGSVPCRIIAPSRPGYLRTPLSTGRTFAEQASAVAALLDTLGIEEAAVTGVSSGGPAAVELALREPARIGRLVLWAGITSRCRPNVARMTHGPLATDLGAQLALRAISPIARHRLRRGRIDDPRALTTLQALAASFFPLDLSSEGMHNDDAQAAALPDLALEALEVPTLIVHGTADRTVPFAQASRAAQRIPAARLVPVADADHAQSLVAPQALAAIAEFLAGA